MSRNNIMADPLLTEDALSVLEEISEENSKQVAEADRNYRNIRRQQKLIQTQREDEILRDLQNRQAAAAQQANNLRRLARSLEKDAEPWKKRLEKQAEERIHIESDGNEFLANRDIAADVIARSLGERQNVSKTEPFPIEDILPVPAVEGPVKLHALVKTKEEEDLLLRINSMIPFVHEVYCSTVPSLKTGEIGRSLLSCENVSYVEVRIVEEKETPEASFFSVFYDALVKKRGIVLHLDAEDPSFFSDSMRIQKLISLFYTDAKAGLVISVNHTDIKNIAVTIEKNGTVSLFPQGSFLLNPEILLHLSGEKNFQNLGIASQRAGLVTLAVLENLVFPDEKTLIRKKIVVNQETLLSELSKFDTVVFSAANVLLSNAGYGTWLPNSWFFSLVEKLEGRGIETAAEDDGSVRNLSEVLSEVGLSGIRVVSKGKIRETFPYGSIAYVSQIQCEEPDVTFFQALGTAQNAFLMFGTTEPAEDFGKAVTAYLDRNISREGLLYSLCIAKFLDLAADRVEDDCRIVLLGHEAPLLKACVPDAVMLPVKEEDILLSAIASKEDIINYFQKPYSGTLGALGHFFHIDFSFPYDRANVNLPGMDKDLNRVFAPLQEVILKEAEAARKDLKEKLKEMVPTGTSFVLLTLHSGARVAYALSLLLDVPVQNISYFNVQEPESSSILPDPGIDDVNIISELVRRIRSNPSRTKWPDLHSQITYIKTALISPERKTAVTEEEDKE